MIEGVVNADYEARLTLTLEGPQGQTREIDALVDTGHNRWLTLPPTDMIELGLDFFRWGKAAVAGGRTIEFPIFYVTVHLNGRPEKIESDVFGQSPLIGMQLLKGHDLHIEVEPDGRVVVEALRA